MMHHARRLGRPSAVALLLVCVGSAFAFSDAPWCVHCDPPAYPAPTGRDLRNFPPHLHADFLHMDLEILIPDMNTPTLTATQHLRFKPLGEQMQQLVIDAKALDIHNVTAEGYATAFTTDGARLTVTFDPPIDVGHEVTLVTRYVVNNPPQGLTWTTESPEWPDRPAQLHTQGQPQTNSYWFPCHDFPNDQLTTAVTVTVPAGFTAVSNGRLVQHRKVILTGEESGNVGMKGYERFEFMQDKPHAPYLVTLAVGKWDVVELGTSELPMPVYAPLGRGKDVKASFGRTGDMVKYFEKRLDEPYPWDKYAQVVVWNFHSGGMENTSATTLHENVVLLPEALPDHDPDGLIAHELAHQWYGDLTTCNSWEHIWLNEGVATFLNTLWLEERDGVDAYLASVRAQFDDLILKDKADAPKSAGMISNVYRDPWQAFRKPANPYSKGCSVLHMLRVRYGDELFFRGLATFLDRHKHQTVETDDFRKVFEDLTGDSLEQFFWQWGSRPGVPHLAVASRWDGDTSTLHFTVEQTQNIDGDNPAYEFDLPVEIHADASDEPLSETIKVRGRSTTASIQLPGQPRFTSFDPHLSVLAAIHVDSTEREALAALAEASSLPARIQAARTLGRPAGASVAGTLALRAVIADSSQHVSLRAECVKSLLGRGADSDLRALASETIDAWQVREATSTAMADLLFKMGEDAEAGARTRIIQQLAHRAVRDKSLKVRAASLKGLGKVKAVEARETILAATSATSQSDIIRQAAIEALVGLDEARSLDLLRELKRPGVDTRTRAAAAEALGKVGHHDPAYVLSSLKELLGDGELRVRRGAGAGVVALKDTSAIGLLMERESAARGPDEARMFRHWIEDIREASSKPGEEAPAVEANPVIPHPKAETPPPVGLTDE